MSGLELLPSQPARFDLAALDSDVPTMYDTDFAIVDTSTSRSSALTQTEMSMGNTIVLAVQPSLLMDIRLRPRAVPRRLVRRDPLPPGVRSLGRSCSIRSGNELPVLAHPALDIGCVPKQPLAIQLTEEFQLAAPVPDHHVLVRHMAAVKIQSAARGFQVRRFRVAMKSSSASDKPAVEKQDNGILTAINEMQTSMHKRFDDQEQLFNIPYHMLPSVGSALRPLPRALQKRRLQLQVQKLQPEVKSAGSSLDDLFGEALRHLEKLRIEADVLRAEGREVQFVTDPPLLSHQ